MPANNDSACTQTFNNLGHVKSVVLECSFDSGDGSFADVDLDKKFEGELLTLETNPGSTAPSDNYDITLVDDEGHDVLEGVGDNRDTANTEKAAIPLGTYFHPVMDGTETLTLKMSGNSVNSATTKIKLVYR